MGDAEMIHEGIYLVGGPGISHFQDATIFIVDCGGELVMIDSGSTKSGSRRSREVERKPDRCQALVSESAVFSLRIDKGRGLWVVSFYAVMIDDHEVDPDFSSPVGGFVVARSAVDRDD